MPQRLLARLFLSSFLLDDLLLPWLSILFFARSARNLSHRKRNPPPVKVHIQNGYCHPLVYLNYFMGISHKTVCELTYVDQTILVQFDGSLGGDMPWKFKPTQKEMRVRLGETAINDALATETSFSNRLSAGLLSTLTRKATDTLPPAAISPSAQLTVALPLQLPWLLVADNRVTSAGRLSVTTTARTVSGPALLSWIA